MEVLRNQSVSMNIHVELGFSDVPFSFVDRDMIMRHYWGLGVGHTYAHISAADARSLHLTNDHLSSDKHIDILPEGTEDQPEDVDEDSELGDDDMVYAHDDRWSDSSGGSDAEFEARYDMYGI